MCLPPSVKTKEEHFISKVQLEMHITSLRERRISLRLPKQLRILTSRIICCRWICVPVLGTDRVSFIHKISGHFSSERKDDDPSYASTSEVTCVHSARYQKVSSQITERQAERDCRTG